ncbi:MAG: efflux RND transporter permease subunit [Candidatus Thiodiazotropha lotti]|uniref:Efflux RND transporter permease subunit n=1 Tax=Candidatus Thiodiazotropha lotti TaxID=2792787 RepID=A0A9E4K9M8_9GAMM|nr:efflux RND transporter permease subunit [Candidatus Thiodiazotropha lotti]MCG7941336.1 efflux RND transporter permease subunit [Candidatus Thiodiazotropha lotti]MCW4205814.1 efflux RND transporter permease subunit [Candidatus Thiodiazotropha lotti]MCW4220574.1 efflux RND transporter permease subunit [Candidatus Thiodiazotropha lotti]ODB99966.1 acriflavine resistance protein B [Candidatus Thiodiazotropha endoloripes]
MAKTKAFTDLFIQRPVLAIVVNLLIVIAGIQAWNSLNIRQYPLSENSTVNISTVYVGANAELVRGFITTPLEQAIASADGIEYIDSKSLQGFSMINARLKLNYPPTKALAEITAKVNQVRNDLPAEAQVPAISIQSADSQFASAYLSFASDILSQAEITDYLIRVVQPRLAAVAGVQRAEVLGARTFAMRIWLKPDKMAALHVSPSQVRQALAANNFLAAIGTTKGSLVQVNMTANTDLHSVEEFEQLIIHQSGDSIVRLQDIADVTLGAEDYDTSVRYTGQTAVFMGIFPLPSANTIDVIKLVRVEIDAIAKDLPSGLEVNIGYDASEYIANAITEVTKTLGDTLLIVIAVIFLFLGSIRSALVPTIAIPVSLIGSIFLMQIFGFTLNLLTLLAIVLSVGLVVDDAIVVVENIERHLREGRSKREAALLGARELLGPVIAMTVTLAAVYMPIALQGGLTGALFREFALTLAGTVTISGIVALTLSPMMSSHMLKSAADEEKGFTGWVNHHFDRLRAAYGRLIGRTMQSRPYVYVIWLVVAAAAVPMYMQSPKELAPSEDQSVVFGIINSAANATADQKRFYGAAVEKAFLDVEEADLSFQILFAPSVGAQFDTDGFSGVVVKPWHAPRERTVFEIQQEIQGKLASIPGFQIFATTPPALPGGSNFPIEFLITSTADAKQLLEFAQQIQGKAIESGMFMFPPQIDLKYDQPQAQVVLDRDKIGALGLNLNQVGLDMAAALGGDYVNRFNIAGRSYKVIPQIERSQRLNPDQLTEIYVSGPEGELIPLSAVAHIENTTVPRSLNRFQQLNAVKLSGMTNRTLDQGLAVLEEAAAEILPPGYGIDYTGESRQLRQEGNKFLPAFALAIVMIFLALAVQFNSFRDPGIILLGSVPLAMFGALLFTFLKMPNPNLPFWTNGWTTTLNIYAQVGLVTLVGLIAKNGILIVEFANKLQEQGLSKIDAVQEAAMTRLRPILMTTFATVAGHFPLILVTGAGAAARNSIGLVLVGGMAVGTLFTLFVLPSIYVLMAKDHQAEAAEDEHESASANSARDLVTE